LVKADNVKRRLPSLIFNDFFKNEKQRDGYFLGVGFLVLLFPFTVNNPINGTYSEA